MDGESRPGMEEASPNGNQDCTGRMENFVSAGGPRLEPKFTLLDPALRTGAKPVVCAQCLCCRLPKTGQEWRLRPTAYRGALSLYTKEGGGSHDPKDEVNCHIVKIKLWETLDH